jgi:8-oxo-dGTP diphosphatase
MSAAPRIVVGAAILRVVDGATEVLAAERTAPASLAGGWEFVGGKVDDGESDVHALIRECREELGVDISVGDRVGDDVLLPGGDAILRVWACRIASGQPASTEHSELRWLGANQLYDVAWLAPDLPIVAALQGTLSLPIVELSLPIVDQ